MMFTAKEVLNQFELEGVITGTDAGTWDWACRAKAESIVQQAIDDACKPHQQKREELLVENATLEAEVERLKELIWKAYNHPAVAQAILHDEAMACIRRALEPKAERPYDEVAMEGIATDVPRVALEDVLAILADDVIVGNVAQMGRAPIGVRQNAIIDYRTRIEAKIKALNTKAIPETKNEQD